MIYVPRRAAPSSLVTGLGAQPVPVPAASVE
jgi:hypothetical protein